MSRKATTPPPLPRLLLSVHGPPLTSIHAHFQKRASPHKHIACARLPLGRADHRRACRSGKTSPYQAGRGRSARTVHGSLDTQHFLPNVFSAAAFPRARFPLPVNRRRTLAHARQHQLSMSASALPRPSAKRSIPPPARKAGPPALPARHQACFSSVIPSAKARMPAVAPAPSTHDRRPSARAAPRSRQPARSRSIFVRGALRPEPGHNDRSPSSAR